MRFKLDENLPLLVGPALRTLGHDVHTVLEENLGGAQDVAVFRACIAEDRVLITLDLDFADIRVYPPGTHPVIWILSHSGRPGMPSRLPYEPDSRCARSSRYPANSG